MKVELAVRRNPDLHRAIAFDAALVVLQCGPTNEAQGDMPFMILFDVGSAEIGAEGQAVVDHIVKKPQAFGSKPILLVAHADRSGPSDSNMMLSRRRAEAVHDALICGGISPSSIDMFAVGEEYPALSDDDGIRETTRPTRRYHLAITSPDTD